jgi:Na+/H+-dicarboxylate symporter
MKTLLGKWNKMSLFTRIMIGFVLGIIFGLIAGESAAAYAK